MKDNTKLAKHIYKEIQDLQWGSRGHLFRQLTVNSLSSWITAFQVRHSIGHSEWSERYQKNIWVSEYKEDE
jgi:hypothetical protein|tara:strand:- start:3897 stop:4109 length:213 start_codon:yes stop_codon:yes gene_type:complete